MVKEMKIDLHTHTNFSDGFLSPEELLSRASNYGIKAIAITDHDTQRAYRNNNIFDLATSLDIELIPGIEFSTQDMSGHKYHILGLMIDFHNTELIGLIDKLENNRISYAQKVVEQLRLDEWSIEIEPLIVAGISITKAHISRLLIENPKNKQKLLDFFGSMPTEGMLTETFLIKEKKYYVSSPDKSLEPGTAIDIIHKAKGVAILAHPAFSVIQGEELVELCNKFRDLHIDGFEAINIQFNKSDNDKRIDLTKEFSLYCKENKLLITGGSDFHHDNIKLMGNFIDLGFHNDDLSVDYSLLSALRAYRKEKYGL